MPQCHSTNEIAAQILDQSAAAEGTVVITDRQLKGKGQRGSDWLSEDFKNLTLSVVLKPSFLTPGNRFYLNIVTALGVREAAAALVDAPVYVKWPNDIMAEGAKLAGILIENQVQGPRITHSVAGIGLNVNQLEFSIPSATSLAIVSGKSFDLARVFEVLLECVERRYLQLRQGATASLKASYEEYLYWKDDLHTFSAGKDAFQGRIRGIDPDGHLHIESGGRSEYFGVKQVRYVS